MKKFLITIVLCFTAFRVSSQLNLTDTFRLVLNSKYPDTVKADKINNYVYQYASIHPEITLLYCDSAIYFSTRISDSSRMAHSFTRKGVAYYYLGDYSKALENYFASVRIKERSGNTKEIWREYNNIGLILREQDQINEALGYFYKSLEALQKSPNKNLEAIFMGNIGLSFRGLKQFDKAIAELEKALEINLSNGNRRSVAQNFNNLGNVYLDLNKYEKAIDYYRKALAINEELHINYEEVQNLNNLARVSILIKDNTSAGQYLQRAKDILTRFRADQLKMNNLDLYSEYFFVKKDYQNAFIYKQQYSKLKDSLDKLSSVKQFEQLKTLANAENELQKLEYLRKINEIQQVTIKNQKIIQIGTGLIALALILMLFFMFRTLKLKKRLNLSLKEQADELTSINEELRSANEELAAQREETEMALDNLKLAQSKLIQSEKMASLGILAAGVAHEINNPLNFIQGGIIAIESYFNETLKDHLELMNPLIDGIKEGVSRASSIVTSLNHYSRLDDMPRANCDIHLIFENCLLMLQNETKNRIEIFRFFTKDDHVLRWNESKLHQVILNILTNAVQSIEKEGKILITTAIENHLLKITVEDSGCGISKEDLPKIFDPFFTTKDPGKGTGLGLSICYKIIEEHKGTIKIEPGREKGTCATITLPLVNPL